MRCTRCGAPGPLWDVTYRRNIGAVLMHFRQTTPMQACRRCLHLEYWKHAGILAAVGWTSYYSVVIGPVFLVMNTVGYIRALATKPTVGPGLPGDDGPRRQLLPPS